LLLRHSNSESRGKPIAVEIGEKYLAFAQLGCNGGARIPSFLVEMVTGSGRSGIILPQNSKLAGREKKGGRNDGHGVGNGSGTRRE
jgi:hypothetical protein